MECRWPNFQLSVGGALQLYSYSSELQTFVEAKWALGKFAIVGIVIGTIILFGVIKPNQSGDRAIGSRSANTLAAENDILHRQLDLMSPRVRELEMQVGQAEERVNTLRTLLLGRKISGNTVRSFTNATKESEHQSLVLAAARFRP
jgi:outer membrane murein-binding lipoprotein Lpp